MASRGDIEAGKAHILLYMKSTVPRALQALKSDLNSVGTSVLKVGAFLTGIGAGIIGPLTAAVAHFASAGSELNDMSARTGIAASSLVELKFAAEQTGSGIEAVETAIRKMQKTLVEAAAESKQARQSIIDLHLSLKDLAGMPPDLQFQKIAEKIAEITDPTKRAAAALAVFGKSGTMLLPMIQHLAALRAEARALGLAPSERAVQLADDLGDAWDKIKAVASATVFEIGAALAPTIMPILDATKKILLTIKEWAQQNSALVKTAFAIGVGLTAAGVALGAVANTLFAISLIVGGTGSVIAVLGAAIGALLSPIGLVVAAIAGGVAAWALWTESGQAAVGFVMTALGDLLAFGREVIGGIADAMQAGDLELAAKIGWAAVMVVWETAKLQAMKVWFAIRESAISAWEEMTIAARTAIGFVSGLLSSFLDQVFPAWRSLVGAFKAGWDEFKVTALGAFTAISAALNILIEKVKQLFRGIVGVSKAVIPIAANTSGGAATALNAALSASAGLDVGKLFGDATAAGGAAGADARSSADAARAARRAADAAALSDQDKVIAAAKADLDRLREDARKAKEDAAATTGGAKGAASGVIEAGASAAGTFSAAALLALGQGGGSLPERTAKAAEKTASGVDKLAKLNEAMLEEAKAARLAVVV